jgi:hypothetical protein
VLVGGYITGMSRLKRSVPKCAQTTMNVHARASFVLVPGIGDDTGAVGA